MRRLKKKIYLGLWGTALAVLTVARLCGAGEESREGVSRGEWRVESGERNGETLSCGERREAGNESKNNVIENQEANVSTLHSPQSTLHQEDESSSHSSLLTSHSKIFYHPIRSVHSYQECFPDVQDVQIVAARRWGVRPVRNREQAEHRKAELVYVGSSPYYVMDRGMSHSIPYLVPRAALLLHDIGRAYLDSLAIKGVPLHRLIVTSVLRSEEDVARLLRHNGNASDQSCHRFGTTFDICYNRYNTVQPPGEHRREVQNDTLKWVLSEVLRDIREQGRCYIKYEVKQGCFHITTR